MNELTDQQRQNIVNARRALAEAEIGPSADTLSASPRLDLWQPIRMGADLCLAGAVSGHPLLQGPFITTSPLIALRDNEGWARTISRFYQLGQPLDTALRAEERSDLAIIGAYGYPAVTVIATQAWLENVSAWIRQQADH